MACTVLIPARLASSRLPNKPLADIAGIPMVVRVAQRVQSGVPASVRVVVAGDDAQILTPVPATRLTPFSPTKTTLQAVTAWPKRVTCWG